MTVSARAAVSVTAWRVCSAASAAARFARSMKLMARSSPSGLLDRDPLDDVGDVLALVDGLLQEGVDLLPADHLERFGTAGEQRRNGVPGHLVALVLEAVDFDPIRLETLEPAKVRKGLLELLALADDDRRL